MIYIVYFDDLISWAKEDKEIHDLVMQLIELVVDLDREDNASGFFVITL